MDKMIAKLVGDMATGALVAQKLIYSVRCQKADERDMAAAITVVAAAGGAMLEGFSREITKAVERAPSAPSAPSAEDGAHGAGGA